jgi:hypothetical protein
MKMPMNKHTLVILSVLLLVQTTYAYGQTHQSGKINYEFEVNGTEVTFSIPEGLNLITDPAEKKLYPYPENQNLYLVLSPIDGHETQYITIGSRPELDRLQVSKKMFRDMCESLMAEVNSDTFEKRVKEMDAVVDKWRKNKGQPGFEAAKTLETKIDGDAFVMTGIILNEDGSETINCVRMQHFKNRIIVMAVSSRLSTKSDIVWVLTTASSLKGSLK